jgi:hypothetical protein
VKQFVNEPKIAGGGVPVQTALAPGKQSSQTNLVKQHQSSSSYSTQLQFN